METDSSYHEQRMRLLASALQWMMDAEPFRLTLTDLGAHLQLGTWEVQHLFSEYLGRDPIRILHNTWSPSLGRTEPVPQISIFDEPEPEIAKGGFLTVPVQISQLKDEEQTIRYSIYPSCLGEVFVANSENGICQLTFEDAENGLERLRKTFTKAELLEETTPLQELAVNCIRTEIPAGTILPLTVKGTPFQLSVWQLLAGIPSGKIMNYQQIATALGDPKASRAVGTAVGSNPAALFIPCHRVVHQNGKTGHFRWGPRRKQLLLAVEKN